MTTVAYRKRSGEVLKISAKNQDFATLNPTYFGALTDPTFTNGTTYKPLRVLGTAKIWDGSTVRNATQAEIDTFAGAETIDENKQFAALGEQLIENDQLQRRVWKAFLKLAIKGELVEKTNANIEGIKTAIANATNLGTLKTEIAALPTVTTSVTLAQMITALKNEISEDD